jgi:hypothetical protein
VATDDAKTGTEPETPQEPVVGVSQAPPHEPRDTDVRLSALEAEAGRLDPVLRRLRAQMSRIDREASLEDRMLAHALLARAYAARRPTIQQARAEYDKVLALWADPAAAMKQITSTGGADALPRAGQALDSAGEALFFRAEREREAADALKAPKYRGPDTREAINKFVLTSVAPWVAKRRHLIDEAQRAYQKIPLLRPAPPPKWLVASAAQVAAMLETFLAELATIPLPPEIRKDPKLREVYEQSIGDAFAPIRHAAHAARRACQEFARKFHVDSKYSRQCAQP